MVARMRAVAKADPDSAFNQAQLVMMLGIGLATAPTSTREAWIAEAEAALRRAIEIDPEESGIYLARINLAEAKRVPVREFDEVVLQALAKAEGKDSFVFGNANAYRFGIMRAVGRFRDAQAHIVAAAANDPLTVPWSAALNRAVLGQSAEARPELETALAAYGARVWAPLIPYAIFFDAADARAMLAAPPSTIPRQTVECMREIRNALASRNASVRTLGAKKAHQCGDAGSIAPLVELASLAALDDLDGAFALSASQPFDASNLRSGHQTLFWPTSRAMRADPRFLPLVEKLGMMDYWRTTRSQPDVCETEAAPFCAALKVSNNR
jgi:hypothetical protein